MDVVQWLKKRCQKTAKTSSLLSSNEIERNRDIMQIFEHFDDDKSGQLEVNEVIGMLEENGMKMSKKHALEFFDVLDADKSGGLTINEFKEFLFSEDCRESKFRSLTLQNLES
jgi:Ca2+-binding EF-hand superfamily protein